MAKDKERTVNPATAQRKADKQKALKRSRAELQAKRNEKLASRNPQRIQRQIDDLKALEASGDIKAREKAILAELEKDLKGVLKAREQLGDKIPALSSRNDFSHSGHNIQRDDQKTLGKRTHDGQRKSDAPENIDEDLRAIPWPRDTPPPIPQAHRHNRQPPHQVTSANAAPLGEGRAYPTSSTLTPTTAPTTIEAKTSYSSAPQLRDLRKEAINKFVPNAVQRNKSAISGTGGPLLEPEEMDRLEQAGYFRKPDAQAGLPAGNEQNPEQLIGDAEAKRLREEEKAFELEIALQEGSADEAELPSEKKSESVSLSRRVEMEEVEDEEG